MYAINLPMLTLIVIVAPILGICFGTEETYFYEASIFQNTIVIFSLLIFAIALLRIKRAVRGIEGAFPNQAYTMLHFGLATSVLIFNVSQLVELSLLYTSPSHIICQTPY